jgi:hypothetical protein
MDGARLMRFCALHHRVTPRRASMAAHNRRGSSARAPRRIIISIHVVPFMP